MSITTTFFKTLLAASWLTSFVGLASAAAGTKPNIILIYSDDHGWADLGAQGVDIAVIELQNATTKVSVRWAAKTSP